MKKHLFVYLIIFLQNVIIYSQNLTVFDLDASSFPIIKAKFYALNDSSKQINGISITDLDVMENDIPRKVLSVNCPELKDDIPISSLLLLDISGSMCGKPLQIVQTSSQVWVDLIKGKSDCAISSFSDNTYINQDYTRNKNKLLNAVNTVTCLNGTNFDNAFLDVPYGAIPIAKTGKNKKIIILISDGGANFPPNENEIIKQANAENITIYALTIGTYTPSHTKNFTQKTGGKWFDNINSKEDAEKAFMEIYAYSQNDPCEIQWQSGITCSKSTTSVAIKFLINNSEAKALYTPPASIVSQINFSPKSVSLLSVTPGTQKDTTIEITAKNSDFFVKSIKSTNPSFKVTPSSFTIKNGEIKYLNLSFTPNDSGYVYTKIILETDVCDQSFPASGGFPGKKPTIRTIKLIKPNGSEVFIGGTDTLITWEGVLPEEKVQLEYSTDNGTNWTMITDTASGLDYLWHIPRKASKQCLARVTSKTTYYDEFEGVEICNKTWMKKNLDVETYRNGDIIPEVKDSLKWATLTTGAWCYYNNDTANGSIYGKLYNWYAVNDPRGLAPYGWHIPDSTEIDALINCAGGADTCGIQLKSTGSLLGGDGLWQGTNRNTTNTLNFTAKPGGARMPNGSFTEINQGSCFWSCNIAYYFAFSFINSAVYLNHWDIKSGFSVRCVKD